MNPAAATCSRLSCSNIRCTCWGCQCAVKRGKRQASRSSYSWESNAKIDMASSHPRVRMIVTAGIEVHRGYLAVMNPANPRSRLLNFTARAGLATGIRGNIAWGNWVSQIFSHTLVNPAAVTCKANNNDLNRSANHLAQTDPLHLLRLPMRRQKRKTPSQQVELFLRIKCKNWHGEFASARSYDSQRLHRSAQGIPCSALSSKSEITFTARAGLAAGILRQHSLRKLGESNTSNNQNTEQIISK